MAAKRPDILTQNLIHDYSKLKMSLAQIATRYDTTASTIHRRLHQAGIAIRTLSESREGLLLRPEVRNDDLRHDYCDLKLPIATISKRYRISKKTIYNRLHSMGIRLSGNDGRTDLSTKALCRDYKKQKLSTVAIGKKYGTCNGTVGQRLRKAGVQMRVGGPPLLELNNSNLQHDYCKLRMRISDMARKYNCSHNLIARRLREMAITMRPTSESHIGYPTKPKVLIKNLKYDYCVLKLSAREVGLRHDIDRNTVTSRLKQAGISMRPIGESNRLKWARATDEEKSARIRKTIEASHVKPSKPETIMCELLQSLYPDEWKYVGDKDVILGGLNPDFINVNGQKGIVEVFGDWWHSKAVTGRWRWLEVWSKKRHYAKYGFKTLVIWEKEMKNMNKVTTKVERFCNKLKERDCGN